MGLSGEMTEKEEESLGNDEYFHYLDCGDGFMNVCVHMSN